MKLSDFLNKAKLSKCLTSSQYLLTLLPHDYEAVLNSSKAGESLNDCIIRWAKVNSPDITIVDDDYQQDGNEKPFRIE